MQYFRCILRGCALCALIIVLLPAAALAEDPLCGINSLYSAARLLGHPPAYSDLLQTEFVGSEEGSSVAELEKASAKIGLHSLAVTNLTTSDLARSRWPIILHVKTQLETTNYNHFVLFAGMQNGKARILDGVHGTKSWSLAEIACRWDGNALFLSKEPLRLSDVVWPSRRNRIISVIAIASVVALAMMFQKRIANAPRSWLITCRNDIALLVVLAGCGARIFHSVSPDGFIHGPEAVRAMRAANASTFLPKIDFDTARKLHADPRVLFVDARGPEEYREGHIEGAVNLQAYLPEADAMRIARSIPRGRRLVVYCSNEHCPFSIATAQRLLEAGHDDVVIFPEGWNAWRARPDTAKQ